MKARILPNDIKMIGEKIITESGLCTITHVTKDRVIFTTQYGEEDWTWILPNGSASFFIHPKTTEALTLQEAYLKLESENKKLKAAHDKLRSKLDFLKEDL